MYITYNILRVFHVSGTVISLLPVLSHLIHYPTGYVPLFSFYRSGNLRPREVKWFD